MPFHAEYDYSYDAVMRSLEDSYQRLGLERIDILLMHDIEPRTHGERYAGLMKIAMESGYRAMDELRRSGVVSAIGLGVNDLAACEAAMEAGDFDCFLLAGRYTLLEQTPLDRFFAACRQARHLDHHRRPIQFRRAGSHGTCRCDIRLSRNSRCHPRSGDKARRDLPPPMA